MILALVLPRSDDPDPPQESAKGARAAAISTSGSFARPRSTDRMPVFTASNVGPGALVEGAVTIVNAGRATGYFSLSQKDVTDVPGPNGGALSRKLQLEIRDVTRPSKPVAVYTGPFTGIGVRGLGFIAKGSDRDYEFTAMLPDTAGPESQISGENALRGSAASARFVWSALEGAPPKEPPGKAARPKDRLPPELRVSIPRVQPLLTRSYLDTSARCSEACTLKVTGSARLSRELRAGRPTRVRVELPRAALRSLRRRLLAGRPVAVKLTFTARDSAGNRFVVRKTVRLKGRRR